MGINLLHLRLESKFNIINRLHIFNNLIYTRRTGNRGTHIGVLQSPRQRELCHCATDFLSDRYQFANFGYFFCASSSVKRLLSHSYPLRVARASLLALMVERLTKNSSILKTLNVHTLKYQRNQSMPARLSTLTLSSSGLDNGGSLYPSSARSCLKRPTVQKNAF